RALSDHHRVGEAGGHLGLRKTLRVWTQVEEAERVLRVEVRRLLVERAFVEERRDTRPRTHREVVPALRTDPLGPLELVVPIVGMTARAGVRVLGRRCRL